MGSGTAFRTSQFFESVVQKTQNNGIDTFPVFADFADPPPQRFGRFSAHVLSRKQFPRSCFSSAAPFFPLRIVCCGPSAATPHRSRVVASAKANVADSRAAAMHLRNPNVVYVAQAGYVAQPGAYGAPLQQLSGG